jgi:hypothetical protein
MGMTNSVIIIILITIVAVVFMYYYRAQMTDSVIKGKTKLLELRGKKGFSRLTEFFIFCLAALIGWFLFATPI